MTNFSAFSRNKTASQQHISISFIPDYEINNLPRSEFILTALKYIYLSKFYSFKI